MVAPNDTRLADFYRGRAVMVTGHTGLLGRWVVALLAACDATLIGLARGASTADGEPLPALRGDIRDADAVGRAVAASEASVLIHLAAQSQTKAGLRRLTHETNVLGTLNILEAAAASGVLACVVASSSRDPRLAAADADFWDPYNASKLAAEQIVLDYRHDAVRATPARGVAIARPAVLIGGDPAAGRLVPQVLAALERGEAPVLRTTTMYRPWQHAIETAAGILWLGARLAQAPADLAPAYNFGMPAPSTPVTVGGLARRLTSLWNGTDTDSRAAVEPEAVDGYWLDCQSASHDLGWAPCWTLDQALAAAVDLHRAQHTGPHTGRAILAEQVGAYTKDARAAGVSWAQPSTVRQ